MYFFFQGSFKLIYFYCIFYLNVCEEERLNLFGWNVYFYMI